MTEISKEEVSIPESMPSLEGKYVTIPLSTLVHLMASERVAREQALLNPVTGLPNSRALERYLARKHEDFLRRPKTPDVTLVDMDLTRFKSINDEFGDTTGDGVLQEVGQTLLEALRPTDFLCNPRGDQFIAILEEVDDSQAKLITDRLTDAVNSLLLEDEDKNGETRIIQPVLKSKSYTVPGNTNFGKVLRDLSKQFYEKPREKNDSQGVK